MTQTGVIAPANTICVRRPSFLSGCAFAACSRALPSIASSAAHRLETSTKLTSTVILIVIKGA